MQISSDNFVIVHSRNTWVFAYFYLFILSRNLFIYKINLPNLKIITPSNNSLTFVWQPIWEKENIKFKTVKLHLETGLVLHSSLPVELGKKKNTHTHTSMKLFIYIPINSISYIWQYHSAVCQVSPANRLLHYFVFWKEKLVASFGQFYKKKKAKKKKNKQKKKKEKKKKKNSTIHSYNRLYW